MKFYCFYVELFHVASEASFWLKAEELTGDGGVILNHVHIQENVVWIPSLWRIQGRITKYEFMESSRLRAGKALSHAPAGNNHSCGATLATLRAAGCRDELLSPYAGLPS
ncbi:uncharacterized protein MCYG_05713 [Microsporum canis CBS 113480]|uniref:Uncharacterized protein n=1 Tax=Arthroderma otae (strain ATCC MYA-4605 / CBS 113480) TaxID=554155 RepID=C5FSP1_ARTOC|nr:uncharacterized protein MCYG_05713 [Microsporum canis CBS 113480]EEQ32894.1 predicted protein [Microsporum canis CBS 113480]